MDAKLSISLSHAAPTNVRDIHTSTSWPRNSQIAKTRRLFQIYHNKGHKMMTRSSIADVGSTRHQLMEKIACMGRCSTLRLPLGRFTSRATVSRRDRSESIQVHQFMGMSVALLYRHRFNCFFRHVQSKIQAGLMWERKPLWRPGLLRRWSRHCPSRPPWTSSMMQS